MSATSPSDPRPALFLGILVLFGTGLIVRVVHGPPPVIGYAINRSLALESAGDPVSAYHGLQGVLERTPEDPDSWYRVGRSLRTLDRDLEAAFYLRRASVLAPASHEIRYELAKALASAGLPEQAAQEIEEVLARKEDHADALYLRSALAASRGDVDASMRDLERAIALLASNPDRYRWDPLFDPVRNDLRFLETVHEIRHQGLFQEEDSS